MIELTQVSVSYRVANERIASLKEYIIRLLQRKMTYHIFHALNDISLTVNEGEVLGIFGHNGAGKSTLLKVIARVLRPTKGRIRLAGRVFPLLELGAGFDMELTGAENIYLNGAILGFKKVDIAKRFDRIVAFAGLEEFIHTPARNYSSGMISRLGFAIATDVQPEILIVDEVLSVGDAEFQRRSAARMQEFCRNGATVIIVSHETSTLRKMCHRALWLEQGRVRQLGTAREVIDAYVKEEKSKEKMN